MYPWMVLVVVMIVLAMLGGGIWWALADYILDRVGPAPAEWGSQDRR